MRLYAVAAALMLVASTFVRASLRNDPGPILTVAEVLFWASGVVLVALAVIAVGRRLGVFRSSAG
ncbi:MAG: hypothetical protein QOG62_1860 [Thermoleophilaceae bacterium]|jgi:hypothetical protein|nr:hypothetical protein [Thermoleophilaceae bacterium]